MLRLSLLEVPLMTNRFAELTQDIQDRIREIAYLMWESAGRQHGMAMQYWLAAEQEVLTTLQVAAERMMPDFHSAPPSADAPVTGKAAVKPAPAVASEAASAEIAAPGGALPESGKPAPRRTTTRPKAKS
jgi:hypothetical protein